MGGGVSLGSFSGASLTEAIKLLLLFGHDKKGVKYTDVVIDGMSGASAGAIALVILLKSLIDYKKMMEIFNGEIAESKSKVSYDSLLKEIVDDYYNGDVSKLTESLKVRNQLVALQLAQKVQRQIWVEQLNSTKLFGDKVKRKYAINPHASFSLLDRSLLVQLAKAYVVSDFKDNWDLENRQLLDPDRVILACSLTNMLPIELQVDQDPPPRRLQENVLKSIGSQNHTELRVIDFVFNEKIQKTKASDASWFKLSKSGEDHKMDLHIDGKKAWAVVTATALACGAFPVAFEPVLLKRYKEEFPNNAWPKVFGEIQDELAGIPQNKLRKKSFFNEAGDNYVDYDSFNFPYIDGGTFNNEPIREAFRIGSFQDFGNHDEDFDRLILFVDPAVREEKHHSFNVNSFASVVTKNRNTKFKKEAAKLFDNITGTVGVLANQGSIKEEHRIDDMRENLLFRDELFDFIGTSTFRNLTVPLVKTAFDKIHKNLQKELISIGTRDVLVYFQNELIRNCLMLGKPPIQLSRIVLEKIHSAIAKNSLSIDQIFDLLNEEVSEEGIRAERNNVFAQTVFRMMADFSLKTVGKNERAEQLSILPVAPEVLYTVKLPGSEVAAFAGFASLESRKYAFEYGRLSTLLSLSEADEKKGFRGPNECPILRSDTLNSTESRLTRVLLELAFYKKSYRFSKDLYNNLYAPGVDRVVNLLARKGVSRWTVGKVPSLVIGSFAGILAVVAPFYFFKFRAFASLTKGVKKYTMSIADEINYKRLIPITISVLSQGRIRRKTKLTFRSSIYAEHMVPMKEYRKSDGTYQYLFQLYYLEYLEQTKSSMSEMPESITTHKTDSKFVKRLGLTLKDKVTNPSIDSSLNGFKWRAQTEKESREIELKKIEIKGVDLGDIIADINNRYFSLFYSLKNLNYHVNPILEFDLRNNTKPEKRSWYFKENTKAFYMELL